MHHRQYGVVSSVTELPGLTDPTSLPSLHKAGFVLSAAKINSDPAVLLQSLYKNQEEDDLELQGVGSNGQQHSLGNGRPALGGNGQMGRCWLPSCPANIAAGHAII